MLVNKMLDLQISEFVTVVMFNEQQHLFNLTHRLIYLCLFVEMAWAAAYNAVFKKVY